MNHDAQLPLMFLDVDGPLNVYRGSLHPQMCIHQVRCAFTGWSTVRLLLDERHPAMLAELGKVFTLVWATAWEHAANEFISPLLGLGQLPVVEWGPDFLTGRRGAPPGLHWKTVALSEYADGRPFCWLDDESDGRDQAYLDRLGVPGFVLTVSPRQGLGPQSLAKALAFAKGLSGRPG